MIFTRIGEHIRIDFVLADRLEVLKPCVRYQTVVNITFQLYEHNLKLMLLIF